MLLLEIINNNLNYKFYYLIALIYNNECDSSAHIYKKSIKVHTHCSLKLSSTDKIELIVLYGICHIDDKYNITGLVKGTHANILCAVQLKVIHMD